MQLSADNPQALTALAQQQGWLTAGQQVSRLSVPGAGNMNLVLRAEINDGSSVIFKQALPWVAKYPQIPAPVSRLDSEAAFYQAVAAQPALVMRTPAVLGYHRGHHLLCMQDLGEVGDMTHLYTGGDAPPEREPALNGLVYWLWKLHALPVAPDLPRVLENRDMRELNHEHIFVLPFTPDNGVELSPPLREAARGLQADRRLGDAAAELGQIYLGRSGHASRPCLLHGDYYPGSWLQHPRMGVMVIDPEFCFVGPPEFDVGVMLAHLTLCGFDQARLAPLLQSYVTPPDFSYPLMLQFAGVEIIRRLLGVAQLPLTADDSTRIQWLQAARQMAAA